MLGNVGFPLCDSGSTRLPLIVGYGLESLWARIVFHESLGVDISTCPFPSSSCSFTNLLIISRQLSSISRQSSNVWKIIVGPSDPGQDWLQFFNSLAVPSCASSKLPSTETVRAFKSSRRDYVNARNMTSQQSVMARDAKGL